MAEMKFSISGTRQTDSQEDSLRLPQNARELLAAIAGKYKHEMTDTEVQLWETRVFSQYPDEMIGRALMAYMESGLPDARYMPRYGVIKRMLEPVGGFSEIMQAVRRYGPWKTPDIQDPVLLEAINQMGGWARVCAQMPDAVERPFDFNHYMKQFDVALAAARIKVKVHNAQPLPLRAIGSLPSCEHLPVPCAVPSAPSARLVEPPPQLSEFLDVQPLAAENSAGKFRVKS